MHRVRICLDEFIVAMQQYVMDLFSTVLEKAAMEYKDSPSLLLMLGKTYVIFFNQNPFSYDFLFSRKNITNENYLLEMLIRTKIHR